MSPTQIQKLRKLLKAMDAADVVQVLLEQGWITEQGEVANDLGDTLESVVAAAFADPLVEDTDVGRTNNRN